MIGISTSEISKSAQKELAVYSLIRPETLSIIALSAICLTLSANSILLPIQWLPVVAVLGLGGIACLCASTLKDAALLGKFSSRQFYKRFESRAIVTPELNKNVGIALDIHRDVFDTIRARPDAPFGAIAVAMDEWVIGIHAMAKRLDTLIQQPDIAERLNQLSDIRGGDLFMADADDKHHDVVLAAEGTPQGSKRSGYDYLSDVKEAVLNASRELDGSISAMYHMQQQLKRSSPDELDRALAEELHGLMRAHMSRLDEAGSRVDDLFRLGEQGAASDLVSDNDTSATPVEAASETSG